MFGLFRPKVQSLAAKQDCEALGKLLSHKDRTIRQASAQALVELLRSPGRNKQQVVARQFSRGLNDRDVVDVLMAAIEGLDQYTGSAFVDSLVSAALHAGAVDPLVAFNKRIAPALTDRERREGGSRGNMLNQSISDNLIAFALARKFGTKELVHIIPYAVAQATQETLDMKEVLKRSETLTLPAQEIQSIRERIDRLPSTCMGLDNYVRSGLGPLLLSKLKETEQA